MSRHRPYRPYRPRGPEIVLPDKQQKEVPPAPSSVPVNGYVLPYGMQPAPAIEPKPSQVIDLGDYNPKFAGKCLVFNKAIDLGILETLESIGNLDLSGQERSAAARRFLKESLLAWNLTRKKPNGEVELLPQPQEGGVERILLDEEFFSAIAQAFAQTFKPAKNS